MKSNDAFPSKYLKAADLQGNQIPVKITHVDAEVLNGEKKFILYFAGKTKGMVLNKTNWNNIAKLYGDESDDWSGKEIVLFEAMVDFQGDTVASIRVKGPSTTRSAPPPQQGAAPRGGDINDSIPFSAEFR